MRIRGILRFFSMMVFIFLLITFISQTVQAKERIIKPPKEVSAVVQLVFPGAAIVSAEREYENGVMFYVVKLLKDKKIIFVEIAEDGSIGTIEDKVGLGEIPKIHAKKILASVKTGKIRRIERQEIRGVLMGNGFKLLKQPRIIYEVKYLFGQRKLRVNVSADETIILNDEGAKDEDGKKDEDEYKVEVSK